jgi:hypothetical protein
MGMMGSRMSKPCRSPNVERAGTIVVLNQAATDLMSPFDLACERHCGFRNDRWLGKRKRVMSKKVGLGSSYS